MKKIDRIRVGTGLLVLASMAFWAGQALAQPRLSLSDAKTQAVRLLEQGQYEKACDLLNGLKEGQDDPQVLFLKGQCKFGMLDFSAAAFQYQLMLDRNTNLPRVRLELARTLAAMGKYSAARREYERILATGKLPPAVRANVLRQLSGIIEHRRWGGVYSIGVVYDSNINSAPSNPNISAFGLPFVLDPESTGQEDFGVLGSVSFGKYFDGWFGDEWRYDVYANFLKYSSKNSYDDYSVGLSIGPNFYSNVQVYLPLGVSTSWEGGSHRATQSISFKPSLSGSLSQNLRASGQVSVEYLDDLRASNEANGLSKSISANLQYAMDQANLIEAGASFVNNEANELAYNRFRSWTVSVGWNHSFSNGLRFSLQPSLTRSHYDEADPVDAGRVRHDKRYGVNLNLYKDVQLGGEVWTPVLSLTWTKNKSNIDRRDYDRKQISLQFRKQF